MFSRTRPWHVSCEAFARVIEARYANHFEVGHNEFEFIFDFDQFHAERLGAALAQPGPQVRIVRIVMGPPFAKSLLDTLTRAVHEYEQQHGVIEQS